MNLIIYLTCLAIVLVLFLLKKLFYGFHSLRQEGAIYFLPIKVDTAGVVNNFAVSLATIPSLIGQFISRYPGALVLLAIFNQNFRSDSYIYDFLLSHGYWLYFFLHFGCF